jgi:hypothetical protein
MAKKPAAAAPQRPRTVDCERCHHFTGRNGWSKPEWGCAKGHERMASQEYTLVRVEGCRDFAALSRDETIFRRFQLDAEWHGDATLKNKRSLARRTATSLQRALAEFGPVLDTEQLSAGKAAVQALVRLADDIERAGKLAVAHKGPADAERKVAEQARLDALVTKQLGLIDEADEAEVIALAHDLVAFTKSDLDGGWLANRKGHRPRLHGPFQLRLRAGGAVA